MCSAPGDLPRDLWCSCFLHSLLMSAIVVSDKYADAILVFCLRGDSLRLSYLRCCATSSSAPAWTSSIFVCFLILSKSEESSFEIKHVLAVNTIRVLVYIFCCSYLYMCTGIYTSVMFLQWL